MGTDVSVHDLRENEFEEWAQFVAASPDGSIYSLAQYLDVLCRTAGGRFSVLAARIGDELAGGVALYECDSRWGPWVSPRALLYYNGLVLRRYGTKYPSEQTARHIKVMSCLAEALAKRGYAWATLRCRSTISDVRPFLAAGWRASPSYTYVAPIGNLEVLGSRMEQNLRRLVKRCENDGVTAGDDDDFESFFRLHTTAMSRREKEQYLPANEFRRYFTMLRQANLCRLYHARLAGGRPLATQFVLLGPSAVSHTVAAAADPAFLRTGASAFLRWKAFAALSAMGYSGNDLTDAQLNSVTHFKSQLGGDLHLSLMLEAPRPLRYRLGRFVAPAYQRAREALRSIGHLHPGRV